MKEVSIRRAKIFSLTILALIAAYLLFSVGKSVISFDPPQAPKPEFASGYFVTRALCIKTVQDCDTVQFVFNAAESAISGTPRYEMKEFPEEAKTEIIFRKIPSVNAQFNYEAMMKSPAIDELNYEQVDGDLVVSIHRKGEIKPAEISADNDSIKVFLPLSADGDIVLLNEEPMNNSTVYPAKQEISIEAESKEPLKKTLIYFQESLVEHALADLGGGKYKLSFTSSLENDQQYKVRAVVTDAKDRTAAISWEFGVQKRAKAAKLNGDRFKYLGWWGKVNGNKIDLYEEPTTQSKKLGMFSTINTVKVLEEVSGESIKRNNLWYKIDGGAHPGAYIFSSFVSPMDQPEPPANAKIPETVAEGEYWIDVDLTKRILTLFQYDKPIFATYVATGRPGNPTLTGTYRIWYKLEKTRMRGGPPTVSYYYNLPNVPFVMYYRGSYAVHGTYWHDKFGSRQSAGCTNLTQGDAKFIFDLVNPKIPENAKSIRSAADNPGTVVYNHY